jgi:insertion element IS1 protein InsB
VSTPDLFAHGAEALPRVRRPGCTGSTSPDHPQHSDAAAMTSLLTLPQMNARGLRDTVRVVHVSPTTVLKELKKRHRRLDQGHQAVVQHLPPAHVEREIWRVDALEGGHGLSSERDELGSSVRSHTHPRWLWHAMDHHPGKGLAYVWGRRQATVFVELKALWEPFGITRYCTEGWGAYERHGEAERPTGGKAPTQTIERQPRHWRTRSKGVVRGALGLAKTVPRHDVVLGRFSKRYEWGGQSDRQATALKHLHWADGWVLQGFARCWTTVAWRPCVLSALLVR